MTTAQIMADMERTREEIRLTIAAIEEKLSVAHLMQQVISPAKTGTIEFSRVFGDALRANPLALGVTAVGLGWLMLGPQKPGALSRNAGRRSTADRLDANRVVNDSSVSSGLAEAAADKLQKTTDRITDTVRRAGETLDQVKTSTRDVTEKTASRVREAADTGRAWTAETVGKASDKVWRSTDSARKSAAEVGAMMRDATGKAGGYVREKPITVGAVLVVGGAALGLLLARRSLRNQNKEDVEQPVDNSERLSDVGTVTDTTCPLSTEEEQQVFAAGNVSVAASRPGVNGGEEGAAAGQSTEERRADTSDRSADVGEESDLHADDGPPREVSERQAN